MLIERDIEQDVERKLDGGRGEFDEIAREAMAHLMEQFWILRDREPEKYQMIRDRESALKSYCHEKLGFRLVVHRYFARLEKIPVEPEPWMGIQAFQHPRDYAVFSCVLAYLDRKPVEEQFLLSELCEDLKAMYPGEGGLDWTSYEHRKSLVRVMKFAEEMGIIRPVEGDVEQFGFVENSEVLYDVSVVSRYFMRPYPKDLSEFRSMEEILSAAWGEMEGEDESPGARRRRRVYRKLFLCPVMYSRGDQDQDFLYLRNFRNRIREDVESHTDFRFELYKDAAMLVLPERQMRYTVYPDSKAIADIALQLAAIVRERLSDGRLQRQADGTVRLTGVDFEGLVQACKERYGAGWSKQYREARLSETMWDLKAFLKDWMMASEDPETGAISLHSALARVVGEYPREFEGELAPAEGQEGGDWLCVGGAREEGNTRGEFREVARVARTQNG